MLRRTSASDAQLARVTGGVDQRNAADPPDASHEQMDRLLEAVIMPKDERHHAGSFKVAGKSSGKSSNFHTSSGEKWRN